MGQLRTLASRGKARDNATYNYVRKVFNTNPSGHRTKIRCKPVRIGY